MTRPRLVLVGTMGAGKTSVGRRLAASWGVDFRDTDHDVEASEGRPVSDIFVDSGEAHFRELERAAVADALATHDGVLALGGARSWTSRPGPLWRGTRWSSSGSGSATPPSGWGSVPPGRCSSATSGAGSSS